MTDDVETPETGDEIRSRLREEIQARAQAYIQTWDGYEEALVVAFHMPVEVIVPSGAKGLVEISDANSSRYHCIGLLFAALHDPRWLDPSRDGE
jgi:hypothetical protein